MFPIFQISKRSDMPKKRSCYRSFRHNVSYSGRAELEDKVEECNKGEAMLSAVTALAFKSFLSERNFPTLNNFLG